MPDWSLFFQNIWEGFVWILYVGLVLGIIGLLIWGLIALGMFLFEKAMEWVDEKTTVSPMYDSEWETHRIEAERWAKYYALKEKDNNGDSDS